VWWISEKRRLIPVIIVVCSCTQFVATLYLVGLSLRYPTIAVLAVIDYPVDWVWLAPSITADFVITVSIYYYLHVNREARKVRNVELPSENIFLEIMRRSIQANILSLMLELQITLGYQIPGAGLWWVLGIATISKAMFFCLLASLNARDRRFSGTSGSHSHQPGGPISNLASGIETNPNVISVPLSVSHHHSHGDDHERFSMKKTTQGAGGV